MRHPQGPLQPTGYSLSCTSTPISYHSPPRRPHHTYSLQASAPGHPGPRSMPPLSHHSLLEFPTVVDDSWQGTDTQAPQSPPLVRLPGLLPPQAAVLWEVGVGMHAEGLLLVSWTQQLAPSTRPHPAGFGVPTPGLSFDAQSWAARSSGWPIYGAAPVVRGR